MKKLLVAAILGLAAVGSVKAQSYIQLYSYGTTSTGNIVYGAGSSGSVGQVVNGYTIGMYWAFGNSAAAVNTLIGGATTQGGANIGTMVGTGLNLATGSAATAAIVGGEYGNLSNFVTDPSVAATPQTITVVLVAYNGTSYESSTLPGQARGHSAAFTMTTTQAPLSANQTGNFADVGGFAVAAPEPSTFALAGLGLASLLIFRRRK